MYATSTSTATAVPTATQLLAAIPQALIATDLGGRVTWWAGAAEALYGWTAEEAVGRLAGDLIVPEPDRVRAAHVREQAQSGRPFTGHFTMQHKDGRTFPAYVMNAPVRDEDGRLIGLLGISHDVTEELAAAHELAEREARYRGIVDTSLEGIWMFDPAGATTFANGRMAELLGLTPERLASSTVFDFVRAENHPGVRRVLDELRRGESARFDTSLVRADGSEVRVDLVASALRDDTGAHLGALAMVSDSSERHASMAALAEQQDRLTHTLEAGGMAAWEVDLATGE